MPKYLYLTKSEWVDTWENGGTVPIALASTYRSNTRDGVYTPDENLIHKSPVDISILRSMGFHFEDVRNFTFTGNTLNGRPLPNFMNADYYRDDGLILSFSNVLSRELLEKLGKEACVVINNIDKLKSQLDAQLSAISIARDCEYTRDHQRNHFLKSVADKWQQEFRMFWPIKEPRQVNISPGTAHRVI